MAIKQIKLDVNELILGMFVSGLDRPWTQTPFPLQGFHIHSQQEIEQLKNYCRHVYIDVIKGAAPVKTNLLTLGQMQKNGRKLTTAASSAKKIPTAPLKIQHNLYPISASLAVEISRARELHQQVYNAVAQVMEQVGPTSNQAILETQRVASAMVDSILRSPDAFTWLSRVREKDEHTYGHAVRAAVWGILYGRHIGLSRADLNTLAMGLLLKDVGKTRLPIALLEASQRNAEEEEFYEQFVDFGVEILQSLADVSPKVIAVVKTHCERIDGSGFPEGLRGDKIPLLGKIAGLVTFYDESTCPRGQNFASSPSKTVSKLYDVRDELFQSDLVIEFIRAIGLYPTGTLVELNTGEVAVVVEQNFERRLKPKIMLVLDANKRPMASPRFLDMAEDDARLQAKRDAGRLRPGDIDTLSIAQDLDSSRYGIDVPAICHAYLNHQQVTAQTGVLGLLKGAKKILKFGKV